MKTLADFKVQKSTISRFYYIPICDDDEAYVTFDTDALEFCQLLNEISYEYGVRTSKINISLDNRLVGMSISWNFDDCERKHD